MPGYRWSQVTGQHGMSPGYYVNPPGLMGHEGSGSMNVTSNSGGAGWQPNVVSLLVLVALEVAAFAALRWAISEL